MMAKYRVYVPVLTEVYQTVEADNPDEALENAFADGVPGLCAMCCGMGFGSDWYRDEDEPDWDNATVDEIVRFDD